MPAKASARARCGIQADSEAAASVPTPMGRPSWRATAQSTAPKRWCVRTLAAAVKSTPAMAVPSARCRVCSTDSACAVKSAARMGTITIPPPMPSSPASSPMPAPTPR